MKISIMGNHILGIMIDLAIYDQGAPVPIGQIAERHVVSKKYLELIIATLVRSGFIISIRGKYGGYRLARSADQYTVGSIIRLIDERTAPATCGTPKDMKCKGSLCPSFEMWKNLDTIVDGYLDNIYLSDLINPDFNGY